MTDRVLDAVPTERANGKAEAGDTITLSTGVVLALHRVPRNLFADLMAEHQPPPVPVVFIESKGREEENPDDPDYQTRYKAYQARLANAMSDAVILLGTSLDSVPPDFPTPDNAVWLRQMRALKRTFHSDEERYLAWVKYKAAESQADFALIWEAVGRQMGVPERDVSTAVRRFPR